MIDISQLNENQRKAVCQVEGPVMILAGAGSGKTRTLVSRICHLIEDKEVSPYKILSLTFSNKAAREMRERVASELSLDSGSLKLTTFHSFCANLLRQEANHIGLSRNFTIYDDSESKAVVKTILQQQGLSIKEVSPFDILHYIDALKNIGYYPGRSGLENEIDKEDLYFGYFNEYEAELHRSNALDFGGLITAVIELFEKFPSVLQVYQKRYDYILVDEYQDTNRVQFELIKMLSGEKKNICVVGDEDQSIYSWRGADIRNILDFEKDFPEVNLIKLEQNYRSSKNIIEAAKCVISNNLLRKGKEIWTNNEKGESIRILECRDDRIEADYVANGIQDHIGKRVPCNDIAVFYRTNSQSRMIEDSLRKKNIPYRVVGGIKFYDRKEIKDMLAYLRVLVNEKDSLAVSRIINVPTRGIGAVTLRKLEQEAIRQQISLWEIIESVVENFQNYSHIKLSAKVKNGLENFVMLISEAKVLDKDKISPSTIYEKILYESGYWGQFKGNRDYESLARMENLEELGSALAQYEKESTHANILGFLENITLDSGGDVDKISQGEVSLMTVHGAKGLEFPYVYIVGAEENIFPSFRSFENGEQGIEEERRLFYVAMTRAMKELNILFAQSRMLYGQIKFNGPSRFIDEIPENYFIWEKVATHSALGPQEWDEHTQEVFEDDVISYQIDSKRMGAKFSIGANVYHALFGRGIVLESQGIGNDEKVLLKFSDGTRKKFLVKYAPLKLID